MQWTRKWRPSRVPLILVGHFQEKFRKLVADDSTDGAANNQHKKLNRENYQIGSTETTLTAVA